MEKPMAKPASGLLTCPGCAALSSKLARMKSDAREESASIYKQHESALATAERATSCALALPGP
eukprot:6272131-Prymnesium_polylepis.1